MSRVDATTTEPPKFGQLAYDITKGVVLFVGLAPPLGGLVVALMMLATQAVDALAPGSNPEWNLALGLLVVAPLFSYLVAALPAAVAGVFAGLMRRVVWPHRVLITSILSAVCAFALVGQFGVLKQYNNTAGSVFFVVVPSFLSAAGLSRWFFRRAEVQPLVPADVPASAASPLRPGRG